ncbi:MAG: alpha/beta fold hydrolase [Polyangiaceae bacterium]|nr:alpha/beta fold hydrolase [Polyangiaceae bacterium]
MTKCAIGGLRHIRRLGAGALSGALVCVGCGEDSQGSGGDAPTTTAATTTTDATSGSTNTSTNASSTTGGMVTTDFQAGDPRPVTVHVPSSYDPATPTPLLILLHGYTATGAVQNAYFGLEPVAEERGIIYAYPDGTTDTQDSQFWNATDACCNFYGSNVDDVAYLMGLVDEITTKVNVDPKRIFFVGHSNGGFMSYRLACEASDRIAAIVSLAGATFEDPADCDAPAALSVLQIHGDMDDTVLYAGGTFGAAYPSAAESTSYFATRANCSVPAMSTGQTTDIDGNIDGPMDENETTIDAYADCDAGYGVELWTIPGGGHVPALAPGFADKVVDFLMAHPKP